ITKMPWDGHTVIEIRDSAETSWSLRVRKPSWASQLHMELNGHVVEVPHLEEGYIVLEREWRTGDVVALDFNLTPTFVEPNPRVDAIRGCVAIQRGPIIYCLEKEDHPTAGNLLDVEIDTSVSLKSEWRPDLLGGVMVVRAQGYILDSAAWNGHLYESLTGRPPESRRPINLVAIPYYAWGNRTIGAMRVWIPKAQ